MALIEIPNILILTWPLALPATDGSPLSVSPLWRLDLINTVAAPGSPVAGDPLSADRGAQAWWRIERARVPSEDLPDIRALRRLRSALRDMIEALVDGCPVRLAAVSDLNSFMQSAPASTRLQLTGTGLRAETQWHQEYGGNPGLAFIAAEAAEFLLTRRR